MLDFKIGTRVQHVSGEEGSVLFTENHDNVWVVWCAHKPAELGIHKPWELEVI